MPKTIDLPKAVKKDIDELVEKIVREHPEFWREVGSDINLRTKFFRELEKMLGIRVFPFALATEENHSDRTN